MSAPLFSSAELERRWREVLARAGAADCVVCPSFHNSYYLSGAPVTQWGRFSIALLFRDGEPALVLPAGEATAVEARSPIRALVLYEDADGPSLETAARVAARALAGAGVRTVGVEARGMPAAMYLLLRESLPEAELVDVSDAVDDVRLVCSQEELRYVRAAASVASAGMEAVLARIRPGVAETALAAEARQAMQTATPAGVQAAATCYMQQGERSLDAHAASSDAAIEAGSIVEIVCECEVFHYQAAVERCVLVGEVSEETERAYAAMLAAFAACGAAVHPGSTFAEADLAARDALRRAGYERITNGSGLARGLVHHTGGRIDAGNLRAYNRRAFEPGMVISVEPWALVPGVGGPRHCDTVVVTETGSETLTDVAAGELRVGAA